MSSAKISSDLEPAVRDLLIRIDPSWPPTKQFLSSIGLSIAPVHGNSNEYKTWRSISFVPVTIDARISCTIPSNW